MAKLLKLLVFTIKLVLIFQIFACQSNDSTSTISFEKYQIEDGFTIEAIATEPLIEAPVAMEIDNEGRLWVVCMNGYMLNTDGIGEDQPNGSIIILEDSDNDGKMDHKKVFLDSLVLPRALALVYGGLLYAEPPNLWFVEIENDQPTKKTLVDSLYAVGGNVEHQPNGLLMNLDNWIYSARCTARYRKFGNSWVKDTTAFRGQWGITQDDYGRLFYNDNSNPLYGDYVMANQLERHPELKPKKGLYEVVAKDRRVFPLHATSVNRGYMDGVLDEEQKLKTFTSACGPLIYRGDQFPEEYYGNAFVCGPEVNLLKRLIVDQKGLEIQANQAWEGKEFLAATDETFRPVNLNNAPDGSMYVIDMHRGIIQHKTYMTSYLLDQLIGKGLDTVKHYGRILRITHGDFPAQKDKLSSHGNGRLVENLKSKNGWIRDRSQQFLIERNAVDAIELLKSLSVDEAADELARTHSLWTLEGLEVLTIDFLSEVAKTKNPGVMMTAIRLSERFDGPMDFVQVCFPALELNDDGVDLQLALSASRMHDKAFIILEKIIERHEDDLFFYEAILSGLQGKEKEFRYFLTTLRGMEKGHSFIKMLDDFIVKIETPKLLASSKNFDVMTNGLKLYQKNCASCHGHGGEGLPNLAPPLYGSEYVESGPEKLILIALHGLQGPVHVNGKLYEMNAVMPGLKDNPDLNDQEIAAILTYVRNSFGREPMNVLPETVAMLREETPQNGLFTEKELLEKYPED